MALDPHDCLEVVAITRGKLAFLSLMVSGAKFAPQAAPSC
jgi:hypothetical protein